MVWTEVADGVFRCRYEPWDVTVAAVRGRDGLLLVDTRASPDQARDVVADVAPLGRVTRVVNTHAHFDHTYGNEVFTGVPIVGHAGLPARLREEEPVAGVTVTAPTELVREPTVLDVGGRAVELVHLGRGHTDHDLLVHVLDAGVWLAGDVVEESGPPAYGDDAFPLEWADVLTRLLDGLRPGAVVVPGHGEPVGAAFVRAQRNGLAAVADLVRELHAAGVSTSDAVAEGGDRWPFPPEAVAGAVRAGYGQLAGGAAAG